MSKGAARFGLVNLGCPKNTVDSEGLLGAMALAGFRFVGEPEDADVCIVNTCGFLDASRREAAGVLEELAARRGRKGRPLLVATGCLVERAGGAPELAAFLGKADGRVGFADYPRLPEICARLLGGEAFAGGAGGYAGRPLPKTYLDFLNRPRMRIGAAHSAYLKVGEGCSNDCAYCSIPLIRGRRASRPVEALVQEARQLVDSGAVELNLIAQDTTAYGVDFAGAPQLPLLLRTLFREIPETVWFRVLYAHPKHLSDAVLAAMGEDARVCPYVDVPLQHVADRMLRKMGRGHGRERAERVVANIRRRLPGAAVRTTFIVGHPGESEADFEELLAFVAEGHFDHAGAFVWSPEPGTASARMRGRVAAEVAEERRDRLMRAQAKASAARMKARVGAETQMLLEERGKGGWIGRTAWQAPEVDGAAVLETARRGLRVGQIAKVRVVGSGRYDCRVSLAEA